MEVLIVLAVTAAVIGLTGRLPDARRVKRELAGARRQSIDALAEGMEVVVRGTVIAVEPGASLIAPISGLPCVYWLVTFDELGTGGDFVELGRSDNGRSFLLASPAGTARIVPDHPRMAVPGRVTLWAMKDLDASHRDDPAIRLARAVCKRPNYPATSSLRMTEYRVVEGMEVTIKGYCTREPDPDATDDHADYRSALPMRAVISGTRRRPLLIG